jgi:hypothetical protein
MAGALVFVPLSAAELRAWAESGTLAGPHVAYAVTEAMAAAFGLDDAASEDAEYTALCIASIAGLMADGVRIVAVAEAGADPSGDDFGTVRVTEVPYSLVASLFGEDADPAPAARAAASVAGFSLAAAWDAPEVVSLLADADLLWYGPAEWDRLTG